MKRRTFTVATLAALCAPFAGAYNLKMGFEQSCSSGHRADLAEILCRLVRDPESAAWIGRRYLAMPGAHSDVRILLDDQCMHFLQRASSGSSSSLTSAFHQQRVSDFSNGDVVLLDNWILARSEVHVFAALALLQRQSEAG